MKALALYTHTHTHTHTHTDTLLNKYIKESVGITLVSLVITIIVIIILASIATYSGLNVVKSSKFTKFSTEMKIMQTQVNKIYDSQEDKTTIGKEIALDSNVQAQANKVFSASESGIIDQTGYKYFDQETIKSRNIEGVEGEFFVNIEKRSIVSYDGFEYGGKKYYTVDQIPNGMYNVNYENSNVEKPTFDVSYETLGKNLVKVKITNIQYSGYIEKWEVKYKKRENENWNTTEDMEFTIKEDGIYEIKLVNEKIESEEKQQIIATEYRTENLLLHYDAINNTGEGDKKHSNTTTIWKDLSGNGNDGILQNFNNTNDSRWNSNYLKFDGTDDTVDTGLTGATTIKSQDNYTLEITFNLNGITADGTIYIKMDNSIIFGSMSWCGYGILWQGQDSGFYDLVTAHRCSDGGGLYQDRLTATYRRIYDIKQKNIITMVHDTENRKMRTYLNKVLIEEKDLPEEGKYATEYDRAEYMNNIKIDSADTFEGNPKAVYSNMNVYSARIYKKALTSTEVLLNQEMDSKRFFND